MSVLRGMLSDLFAGVVSKRLTPTETLSGKSTQQEFQGSRLLKRLLGEAERQRIPARFLWLSADQEAVSEDGFMTWSDVRKRKPRSAEYHLYYSRNGVTEAMRPGDRLFLALRQDGALLAIITPAVSTAANQLLWLFGLDDEPEFAFQPIDKENSTELGFAARYVLDELGIEFEEADADRLDGFIERFGLTFPSMKDFSEAARRSLPDVAAADDPDAALIMWMEREEQLFRRLERRIVAERISAGFQTADGVDVDGFINFSLSVQNRRKRRAGDALENHLEQVFRSSGLLYARGAETEFGNTPDFLFPGQNEYRDPVFPPERRTMLGAKSSLKDRWRQVLSEAQKIQKKHLLTVEPGVSRSQTDEMRAKSLQLVVPRGLHSTYHPEQQAWLMNLAEFITLVRERQLQA